MISQFSSELTDKEITYLLNFEYKTSNIYGLPKIHKSALIANEIDLQQSEIVSVFEPTDLKLRPIIAGPACPTHRLSHFLDIILQPYVKFIDSYVKDDIDVLRKLPNSLSDDFKIASYDVENLYGNISHQLGLEIVSYWLSSVEKITPRISDDFILRALKFILENNSFHFNGNYYRQVKGTVMGTKVAPIYATLTLGYLEQKLYQRVRSDFTENVYHNFRKYYLRYLDDVLIIFDDSKLPIETIGNLLNDMNAELNFILETNGNKVNFLDLTIYKRDQTVETYFL